MMKDEYFKLLMAFEDKRTFVSVELFSRLKTYGLEELLLSTLF